MKLNVSEVPSQTWVASSFPLREVQGEIVSARKAASSGENWRKEQLAIIKALYVLKNQKGIEVWNFVQLVLTMLEVWEMEMNLLVLRYLGGETIKGA